MVWQTEDGETSAKSDGYTCSWCGLQFGDARDVISGVAQDRYWRSQAHYNYESLFGTQFVSAVFLSHVPVRLERLCPVQRVPVCGVVVRGDDR